jgi:carbonic anhydrase
MQPALAGVDRSLAVDTQVARGVEAMVRYEVDQLAKTAEYKQVLEGHHVTVLGAVYDVASGRVRFLNEQ